MFFNVSSAKLLFRNRFSGCFSVFSAPCQTFWHIFVHLVCIPVLFAAIRCFSAQAKTACRTARQAVFAVVNGYREG
jgi:hypothetical protein